MTSTTVESVCIVCIGAPTGTRAFLHWDVPRTVLLCSTFNKLKTLQTYMGVDLNGGTPKAPQNDHF